MDMRLELVVLPVTDVDRAKKFYEDAGFRLDVDHRAGDAFRVVQLTPPQSECSTSVNRMPAAASYLRRPGDTVFRAFKLDVLRVDDATISEITTFGDSWFPSLGLAPILSPA